MSFMGTFLIYLLEENYLLEWMFEVLFFVLIMFVCLSVYWCSCDVSSRRIVFGLYAECLSDCMYICMSEQRFVF
jgi:hypothetical protein